MLEIVTFTGVDSQTSTVELTAIAERYPRVEYGVLVSTDGYTGRESGIFPPHHVVDTLRMLGSTGMFQTSIHLCGEVARRVMSETWGPAILRMCDGFSRVQLNLHGDAFNPERIEVSARAVQGFAEAVDCRSLILQHRRPWNDVPFLHPRVEYLFDLSEGRGQESFQSWPRPPIDGMRVGYAGGLGPHNIRQAVDFAGRYPDAPLWLDMEGRIRNRSGWLDLRAIASVCRQVWPDNDSPPT